MEGEPGQRGKSNISGRGWCSNNNCYSTFAASFVVNVVVCIGIAVSKKAFAADVILAVLSFAGIELVVFVLTYSMTVIATGLTGNIIISILGTGVLFAYSTGLELLIFLMSSRFFDTYTVYNNRGHFALDNKIWGR